MANDDANSKAIGVVAEVEVGVEESAHQTNHKAKPTKPNPLDPQDPSIPHICRGSHGYTRVNFFWPV